MLNRETAVRRKSDDLRLQELEDVAVHGPNVPTSNPTMTMRETHIVFRSVILVAASNTQS